MNPSDKPVCLGPDAQTRLKTLCEMNRRMRAEIRISDLDQLIQTQLAAVASPAQRLEMLCSATQSIRALNSAGNTKGGHDA